MYKQLPKIKDLPDNFYEKVEKRRQEDFQDLAQEHSKAHLDYLATKIQIETLLDFSLTSSDEDLTAELVVSRDSWTRQIQQNLLNGSGKPLKEETVSALKRLTAEKLSNLVQQLITHWSEENSCFKNGQLPILVQSDKEASVGNGENVFDMKRLKHESRRKDYLQNHVKIAKELVENHALGHVAVLDQLQIEYLSSKKRNLELKTKSKELEAMLKTYTPETNEALGKMKDEFNRKIEQEKKCIAQLRGELEQYSQLGSAFENIAEDYRKVLHEIKHNQWMLETIKDSSSS